MPSQRSDLFEHVRTPPNPDRNPTLWEHRLRQRRPLSLNPFVNISSVPEGESEVLDGVPATRARSPGLEDPQKLPSTDGSSGEELVENKKNHDIQWGEQIPGWLNLFYDLAWTATFSSLTSNNQFREPWVSFTVIFLQLLVFGALAATTRGASTKLSNIDKKASPIALGFDISNYILHSPGSSELHVYDIMTIELERYKAERLTKGPDSNGMADNYVVVFLLQHLRVLIYAKLTSNQGRFPRRLLIVPIGLIISTGLMFGSFSITLNKAGTEPYGAKIKYALWGVAILVEMIAHVIRAQMEINQGIRLRAHGSIASRLCDITTIIIGEGVAPLGNIRRRAAWVMVHLPWLLSVILLLEGVKNQLLLSAGLSWEDEFARLEALYSNSTAVNSTDPNAIDANFGVWLFRVLLSTTLTSYLTFMDNGTISEETYRVIDSYQHDYNFTLEDLHASLENGTAPHYGRRVVLDISDD
ncbi:Bacterial low temperature requirement A protein (LtrA) [Rhizoctonia solani]|uniref:Bacterial low temperature requirement A protein (LtrA) n=1 Tax=Rhizoctonia solani TaxID=456999 RepID=A0A8H7I8D9_9AGAM|nr:Bacterial low temperature requirement A protein (LtrA) [Rhizoctonia solani]